MGSGLCNHATDYDPNMATISIYPDMIVYRLANKSDNPKLLELTDSVSMEGDIALRIDRHPDFFKILELRGKSLVMIAEENNKIIGSVCSSLQNCYIGGELYPVQYIADFKVLKSYRNKGIGMKLLSTLGDILYESDCDLVFLNFSKGNSKPVSFSKDKSLYPDLQEIGMFTIYQFVGKKSRGSHSEFSIELSEPSEELVAFIGEKHQKYNLGTPITKSQLEGTSVFTIRHKGTLIGAMSIIDTMSFKQNIVIKVSRKLNLILKVLNAINPIFRLSKMPTLNQPVKMIYIKYLAINLNEKKALLLLIDHARNIAYNKSYSFVSIGCHENDPLQKHFSKLLKFTFHSIGMMTSLKNNNYLIDKVKSGIPYEDFSLV